MSEDSILMCLIAFVLGYLVALMMRGNGLSVGGRFNIDEDATWEVFINNTYNKLFPGWHSILRENELWTKSVRNSKCLDYLGCYDYDLNNGENCPFENKNFSLFLKPFVIFLS